MEDKSDRTLIIPHEGFEGSEFIMIIELLHDTQHRTLKDAVMSIELLHDTQHRTLKDAVMSISSPHPLDCLAMDTRSNHDITT